MANERLSLDAERAAGERYAEIAIEVVRMAARREWTEKLLDYLKRMQPTITAEAGSGAFADGYGRALDYLKQTLDNPVNWRTP